MWGRFLRQPLSHRSRSRRTIELALEHLEERCLPAIIIGSSTYQTIAQAAAAAQNGDTIQIQAGTYTSQEAVFTQNNLTIEGVGGPVIFNDSGYQLQNEKGIFDIRGNNVTVKNIEFEYAHDMSGSDGDNFAGIRGEGNTLTIDNCSFFHNDDGILIDNDPNFTTDNNDLTVSNSEFGYNGYGDGQSHNMYIGEITSFTLEYSYSHDANQGHLVKSRALNTYLLYNDFADGATGGASSEIDIPYGGNAYLVGNIIENDANAANHNFLTFNLETGPSTYAQQLYVVNNTFVNDYGGGTYVLGNSSEPPSTVLLQNNIFAGGGTVASMAYTNVSNLVSNNPGFLSWNPSTIGGNYQLAAGSPAINAGTEPGSANGFSLVPTEEYVAPLSSQARPVDSHIDIGAYEYATASKTTPTVTWATPAAITYGTALSATQLDATASVAGTLTYTPAAGTVLAAGTQTLNVTFTPTDTTDYTTATDSVTLIVNKATSVVSWATPAAITYGTALSAAQLDATANVAGTFTYTPAAGTVLSAGTQTLNVTFTPTDTTDYTTATDSVTLSVNKATSIVSWATPAAITYGTALSATQLDATANVAGTFTYTPAAGTVLAAGTQTLNVAFTPTDTTDYTSASDSVTLTVNQPSKTTPTVTWATPAAITYGTALSATQLDATASVAGTFIYTPAAGTVLAAGTQTLHVTFTPTDTTDYTTATDSVTLTVNKATSIVSWATPAAITYGTALGATQLDATASVAGTFAYTPAAGTVLAAGTQTLNVTFTPTDTTDYTTATDSVALTVNPQTDLQSATTLTSSANPSVYGQPITLTATVTAKTGSGTPTGSVIFMDGNNALGSANLNSSGVATLDVPLMTVGSNALSAVYSGDASFASSSAALSQTVKKAAAQVALSSSATPSGYGQSVTFTATVSAVSPGSGTPAGTVTFYNSGVALGTVTLSGGVARFTTSALAVGSHTIKATYNGNADFATSSKSLGETVKKDSTKLAGSPTAATLGQLLTLSATVTPVSPGRAAPAGT